jgi:hypothetical protein
MTAPRALSAGKTPPQWVAEFADRGIDISERRLREDARRLGAYAILGRTLVLYPEHIDLIFEAKPCHSKSTNAGANGGSVAELMASTGTSTEALAHLTKQSRQRKSGRSNGKRGNVLSLEKTRQSRKTS